MNQGGVTSWRTSAVDNESPRRCTALRMFLGVQHTDDRIGIAAPQGVAGVGTVQDLAHDLGDGRIGIDRQDGPSVGHHLGDLDLVEVEDSTHHVVLVLLDGAAGARCAEQAAELVGE